MEAHVRRGVTGINATDSIPNVDISTARDATGVSQIKVEN